jgi:hypothetical protein
VLPPTTLQRTGLNESVSADRTELSENRSMSGKKNRYESLIIRFKYTRQAA